MEVVGGVVVLIYNPIDDVTSKFLNEQPVNVIPPAVCCISMPRKFVLADPIRANSVNPKVTVAAF